MKNMEYFVVIEVNSSLSVNVTKTVRDIIIEFLHEYIESTALNVNYIGYNGLEIEYIIKEDANYMLDMCYKAESIFKNVLNALYYNDRNASVTAYFISHNKNDESRELRYIQRYSSWSDSIESDIYSNSINKEDSYETKVKWYNEVLAIKDLGIRMHNIFTSELEKLNKEIKNDSNNKEEESNEIHIVIPKELDEINDLLHKLKTHIENISNKLCDQHDKVK